jgi:hypothetical protein
MIAFGGMIRTFYFQINPLMQKVTYSKISGFDEIKPNLFQQLLCFYPAAEGDHAYPVQHLNHTG